MIDKTSLLTKSNTCFNWSRLVFSASLPLILGIFTIIFTLQQNSISIANREEDRRQAIEHRQQTIYDAYINDISALLLKDSFNQSNQRQLKYIGIKTVDSLRHLNTDQKRDIILFLYNNELVNLKGADLTNVQFFHSASMTCNLRDLYLPFILASKIVFDGCDIDNAVFDNSSMIEAKFIRSHMDSTRFYNANLTIATFQENNMYRPNFSHTNLMYSKFSESKPVLADFTNANLRHSDLTGRDLWDTRHTLINTRYPNGSFSAVDSSQLIIDGGAEELVSCLSLSTHLITFTVYGQHTKCLEFMFFILNLSEYLI
jgi:uncharacterized protein YjbI with pentapeptide repeats